MAGPPDWTTLREAADILAAANIRFTPSTIGAWARTGRLQSIKLGGRRFVRRGQVRALVAAPRRVRAEQLPPGLFAELRDGRRRGRRPLDPAAAAAGGRGPRRGLVAGPDGETG